MCHELLNCTAMLQGAGSRRVNSSEVLGINHRMPQLKKALNSILVVPRGKEKCREPRPLTGDMAAKGWQIWCGVPSLRKLGQILFSLV